MLKNRRQLTHCESFPFLPFINLFSTFDCIITIMTLHPPPKCFAAFLSIICYTLLETSRFLFLSLCACAIMPLISYNFGNYLMVTHVKLSLSRPLVRSLAFGPVFLFRFRFLDATNVIVWSSYRHYTYV